MPHLHICPTLCGCLGCPGICVSHMSACLGYYASPRGSADAIRLKYWGLNARLCFWSPSHYIWSNQFQWIVDSLIYHIICCLVSLISRLSGVDDWIWLKLQILPVHKRMTGIWVQTPLCMTGVLHFSRSFLFAAEELCWTCSFYLIWTNQPNSLHHKQEVCHPWTQLNAKDTVYLLSLEKT